MTLTVKLDLDIVKMYLYAENELPISKVQKLQPKQTDTHSHTDLTEIITNLHMQMLPICICKC